MNAENKGFIRPIGDYRGLIVYKNEYLCNILTLKYL